MFDDHIPRGSQSGRISIDDLESKSYPRWNFRGGPNGTKKEDYCYYKPAKVNDKGKKSGEAIQKKSKVDEEKEEKEEGGKKQEEGGKKQEEEEEGKLEEGSHQALSISVDTEIIYMEHMAWWILHQLYSTPERALGKTPANPRHYLVKVADCMHDEHVIKARRRDADGRRIYTNVETRSQSMATGGFHM